MLKQKLERRFSELRAEGGRVISGRAITYGETAALPWGRERFEPGSFGNVAEIDCILNASHCRDRPLARTGGGLELIDGPQALEVRAVLPKTRDADDVLELIRSKILRGLSIEFEAISESTQAGVRVIESAALSAVAVVDRPAYEGSVAQVREKAGKRPRRLWL